jgi:hypothetical protein
MPRFPRTNGAALAAHVLRHFVRPARVRLRTLLPPLFEDAVRTRVSGEFSGRWRSSRVTPETGWAAVGAPRGGAGTTARVLYMPQQALVVYPPIAVVLANAVLAALNGLRLL